MLKQLWAALRRRPNPDGEKACIACPLVMCERGSRASVVAMSCAREEASRLRALGLYEGSCVTVLDRQDGCLLDVRGSRLALAARLAESITVLPIGR